jgi:dienelactone hydrolase
VPGEGTRTHAVLRLYRPRPCGDSSEPELGALAYLSRAPGAKRWVIVLPIWGSSTYPPQKEAATEAESLTEVSRTASCIDAAAEDVRAFTDWVLAQPETAPRRVGIVGFSTGGIVGSLVMGRDTRFAAGVFVMVGGHLDEILAYCKWDEREVREHAAATFGWTSDELKAVIKAPLSVVDPVLGAGSIDPADVLFIDSGHDGCIPQSARDNLWRAMGEPERVTLGYDHKNSFLTMTFLGFDVTTRRIVAFLDSRLGVTEQPLSEAASATPTAGQAP